MAENIAIIIGNAEYENSDFGNLKACVKDVDAMEELLKATHRFDKIIPLKNVSGDEITEELKRLTGSQSYGTIFIYFSGHGHRDSKNQFYWTGKDFDTSKPHTTGVSHEVLISFLRAAACKNRIVIQDACFSGSALLKSSTENYSTTFGDILMLSSSHASEETPAGLELSPFTDRFIEAASTAKTEGSIDYFDVIQKLKDLYEDIDDHNPYWTYQGSFKLAFCDDATFLSDINKKYTEFEEEINEPEVSIQAATPLSESDILSAVEKKLVPKEKIQEMILAIEGRINEKYEEQANLVKIFSLRSTASADYYNVDDLKPIVEFVSGQSRWDEFVTATHTRTKKRQSAFLGALSEVLYKPEYDENYYLENNSGLEAVHQQYFLEPSSKLLRRHVLEMIIVPGIFSASLFWRLRVQGLENWDTFSEDAGQKKWQSSKFEWDSNNLADLDVFYSDLFEQAKKSLHRTVTNLSAKLSDN